MDRRERRRPGRISDSELKIIRDIVKHDSELKFIFEHEGELKHLIIGLEKIKAKKAKRDQYKDKFIEAMVAKSGTLMVGMIIAICLWGGQYILAYMGFKLALISEVTKEIK